MSGRSISAIVVSYRTGPVLRQSLAALMTLPELVEIIIVDNGNGPAERRFLDQLAARRDVVRLLRPGKNLGFAQACNLAVEQAAGEYVALVNPDLIVPLATFPAVLDAFATHPQAWLCGARLCNMDGSEQRGGRREVATPWRALAEVLRLARLFPNHPHFRRMHMHEIPTPAGVVEVATVSGAFMVMPRCRWRELGGFDARMFLHVEDADLCLRIHKAGGVVLYCGNAPVFHHLSTSDVPTLFIEWHKARSGALYFRKHFASAYPNWALTMVIAALWVRWLLLCVFEGPKNLRWLALYLHRRLMMGQGAEKDW